MVWKSCARINHTHTHTCRTTNTLRIAKPHFETGSALWHFRCCPSPRRPLTYPPQICSCSSVLLLSFCLSARQSLRILECGGLQQQLCTDEKLPNRRVCRVFKHTHSYIRTECARSYPNGATHTLSLTRTLTSADGEKRDDAGARTHTLTLLYIYIYIPV